MTKWAIFLASATMLASCTASATEVDADPLGCVVALMIETNNAKHHGNLELPKQLSPFTKWYAIAGKATFSKPEGQDRVVRLAKDYHKNWQRRKTVAKHCVATAVADPGFEKSLPLLNTLPEMTMR